MGGIVKGDDSPRQTESRTQRRRSARPSLKCFVFGLVRDRSVPEGRAPLVTLAESNSPPPPPKYITCSVYNGRETRVAADCIESSAQDAHRHLGMEQVALSTSYICDLNCKLCPIRTLIDREIYLPIDSADRFRAIG